MNNSDTTDCPVIIHTDGACLGNPGPGGYGAVLNWDGREKELSGGFKLTTNNRMEILAVIVALEALTKPCQVTVVTDSMYVRDAIEKNGSPIGSATAGRPRPRPTSRTATCGSGWIAILPCTR